jgi:ribosomal protein L7Ae-like RNA K-turn-binding protein
VDAASERKLLGLLGLGLRARTALVGVEQVRNAAKRGKLYLAVIAPDASRNSLDKVVPLLRAKRVRVIEGPSASALGAAVGRNATAAIGIVDRDLARGIRAITDQGTAVAQQEGRF